MKEQLNAACAQGHLNLIRLSNCTWHEYTERKRIPVTRMKIPPGPCHWSWQTHFYCDKLLILAMCLYGASTLSAVFLAREGIILQCQNTIKKKILILFGLPAKLVHDYCILSDCLSSYNSTCLCKKKKWELANVKSKVKSYDKSIFYLKKCDLAKSVI